MSFGDMSRSAVTPVVLGMLWHGPLSGYDIRRAVERSTDQVPEAADLRSMPDVRLAPRT